MKIQFAELNCYIRFCLKRPAIWRTTFQISLRFFISYVWQQIIRGSLIHFFGNRYLRLRDKIRAKCGPQNRLQHYPAQIQTEVQKIFVPESLAQNWLEQLPSTGWQPGNGLRLEDWKIPLATYSITLAQLNWHKNEQDEEDIFALHRFIWLLRWLSLHPDHDSLKTSDAIVLDWIEQITFQQKPSAWETYSVAERVVNWLLYLCATKEHRDFDDQFIDKIADAFVQHLNHIVQHLEYYNGMCNNHILNDARALYIGGQLLQLPPMANLGRLLFQLHAPAMIDEEGSLLEDSSHYQLLLTRTFVEVAWVAKITNDTSFTNFLEPITQSMQHCSLYLGHHSRENLADMFPRVGDVSPDVPVAWFYPEPPNHQDSENWWGLWDVDKFLSVLEDTDYSQSFLEWKWLTSSDIFFKALIHTPNNLKTYPRGHGHLDFGSFLLYDANGPILVDRGRNSYSSNLGRYGWTAQAHNSTLINGVPLLPSCQGAFFAYKEYLENDILFEIDETKKQFLWRTNAVNRLDESLNWQRTLTLNSKEVTILESVSNPNKIDLTIETRFHFAPGWKVQPILYENTTNCYLLMKDGRGYLFDINYFGSKINWFEGNEQDGWHFPEYGHQIPALTLYVIFQISQDFNVEFNLRSL